MRVATWNIKWPGKERALRRGEILRKLEPDLILLQEANPNSAEALRRAAGADWLITVSDLIAHPPQGAPSRTREGSRSPGGGSARGSPGSSLTCTCRSGSCSPRSPWRDAS